MAAIAGHKSGTVTAAESAAARSRRHAVQHHGAAGSRTSEGITPARTMRIAESLTWTGLISYPRVDNTVYPESLDCAGILNCCSRSRSTARWPADSLQRQLHPTRGAKETTTPADTQRQRPTRQLKPEEWKLYNLIARRFMATLSDSR